jgi:hypothetical protein
MCSNNGCADSVRQLPDSPANLVLTAYGMLRPNRPEWRAAMDRFLSPAFRLHRFRGIRTRMWQEAIGRFDCSATRSIGCDTDRQALQ